MHYALIANGELRKGAWATELIDQADVVVAVDGGYQHLQQLGRSPELLVGDLDSITPELADGLPTSGIEVVRYPARKDANDLELALQLVRERGATEITLLGLQGARWDQSLANLLLLSDPTLNGVELRVLDGPQAIYVIRPETPLELLGAAGDMVSLIPLRGDAKGVLTSGLEYPLVRETLSYGSSRGISNVMLETWANVHVEAGILLCLHIRGGEEQLTKETAYE